MTEKETVETLVEFGLATSTLTFTKGHTQGATMHNSVAHGTHLDLTGTWVLSPNTCMLTKSWQAIQLVHYNN